MIVKKHLKVCNISKNEFEAFYHASYSRQEEELENILFKSVKRYYFHFNFF